MAEQVIGGDEEPAVASGLDDRTAHRVRVAVGVVGPVRGVGRAGFAGDVRARRIGHDHDLLEALRHLHAGQRRGRGRHVDDHVDAFTLVPFAGDGGGDIGLVLGVSGQELDRSSQHRPLEVLDRHLAGFDIALAADVGIDRGEIRQQADLDRRAGLLRLHRPAQHQRDGQCRGRSRALKAFHGFPHIIFWCLLGRRMTLA